MGIPDHLTCLLKICMQVRKQQLELDMEQQNGSKLGKKYIKTAYSHPANLTYMQSTSCKMPIWMKHKLESRLPGEISISSVQFNRSVMSDSLRPHESQHARPPCPSQTPGVHRLTSIESVMPSSHLILCCPLLLLPPIPPSSRVFSNESTLCMRWPKYWSFRFSISPSKEIQG